ncbi:MAG: signal recognition particle-docking protein FtsY [Candidatus Nanoarchaeia archaeon]|nr:signal recognition particle-docking protein FtsY [Candidatus Nanoarchaeia archaeon]
MFKFLKEKLKGALDKFSKKVEAEAEPVIEKVQVEEKPKKEENKPEIKKEKKEKPKLEVKEEPKEEKKGFFGKLKEKITTTKISEDKFDDLFWELELALLENNVAVEIIEKIKENLKKSLVNNPIKRGETMKVVQDTLRITLENSFVQPFDVLDRIKNKKPYVICFFGINGAGKTTTIAKFVRMLQEQGLRVVLAASDTFRAAAIHQLEVHAERLGVKVIKQDYGSDPAAVAFDAIKHAEAKDIDVVLIDTAGRMHSNKNLMDEMKKIVRVSKPDLKIFIGESITGNDCVEQAKLFDETIGIDGIILSKADVDEKGGAAISVSYITNKPILYLGVGQSLNDLKKFSKEDLIKSLGL